MSNILVDSGFLVAVYDEDAPFHSAVLEFANRRRDVLLVPQVVLTEVFYVLSRNVGRGGANTFIRDFADSDTQLQDVTLTDLSRIHELRLQYADANLDFVDCAIIALAERLDIKRIATLDHRDFALVRPKHCDYFDIYP
jgi:hypothetical protein